MATKYISSLTGPEMDSALTDMAYHNSEAYAVGTRNGVAVGSSDVTYHNNSKYWAEQVYGYTDRAEDAANRAEAAVPAGTAGAVFFDRAQTLTSAEQAQARANIMAGGSNRNLLDNPWFTVRQRGDGAFGTGAQYTVDRWRKLAQGSITGTENGLSIAPTATTSFIELIQYTETSLGAALEGKTIAFSLMTADGTVYSKSGTVPAKPASGSTNFLSFSIQTGISCAVYRRNTGDLMVDFMYNQAQTQTTFVIRAVKLELGSVSTLANDAPPDYGEELAKCMRYFIRIKGDPIGSGYVTAGLNQAYIHISTPVPMRTAPTASINGSMYIRGTGATWNVSTVTVPSTSLQPTNGVSVIAAISATQVMAVGAYMSSANSYIDLTADL